MNILRAGLGLVGTAAIAGWAAYSVSAPRNFENAMNDPMVALEGSSISDEMLKAKKEAYAVQCAEIRAAAAESWERSLENGTIDQDQSRLDELDRQADRFCNS